MRHLLASLAIFTVLAAVSCGDAGTGSRVATLEAENASLRAALSVTPTPTPTPVPPTAVPTVDTTQFCNDVRYWRAADMTAVQSWDDLKDITDKAQYDAVTLAYDVAQSIAVPLAPPGSSPDAAKLVELIATRKTANDRVTAAFGILRSIAVSGSASSQQRVDSLNTFDNARIDASTAERAVVQYLTAVCPPTVAP